MNSDMDKLLAYRNFLAAEDHLDELINKAENSDEKFKFEMLQVTVEALRSHVMPPEVDPRLHCVVKHLSVAYEACREINKAERTEQHGNLQSICYEALTDALELLWGRKINVCERCTYGTGRVQEEDTGSNDVSSDDGVTRDLIQGVGDDREPSIPSSEAGVSGREQDSSTERDITGREG